MRPSSEGTHQHLGKQANSSFLAQLNEMFHVYMLNMKVEPVGY